MNTEQYATKYGIEDPKHDFVKFQTELNRLAGKYQVHSCSVYAGFTYKDTCGGSGIGIGIRGLDCRQQNFMVNGEYMLEVLVGLRKELEGRESRRLQQRSAHLLANLS